MLFMLLIITLIPDAVHAAFDAATLFTFLLQMR